ncbi:hypothetical protein A7Q01_02345 [Eikenella sp. NML96-A-049]|uniref:hypothetical protein n=1 Tax=unclassified Eikenella TaxID=2639367 RepID=UPI0007E10C78|nr:MULTISPECIES: hypothetical protein [unclassified Eikenella]OAM33792.1 hypothetical protein A7P97_07675 [Eikenella sp. NML070372]OAM41793.1 hypothetical protein A7Q01_02345 [Eikenella sp. NML96-A-049]VDG99734.1 Uncharacterised protein [Helicobacter pametensis]
MKDNFQLLDDTRHMLQWFADEPYAEIRRSIESILREHVADSRLLDFTVTSPPDWLTVGAHSESNPEAVTVNRTAVAFEFCLPKTSATNRPIHPKFQQRPFGALPLRSRQRSLKAT